MTQTRKTSEADPRTAPRPSPERHTETAHSLSEGDPRTAPAAKDPEEWTTGHETMTGPQASYLQTLCQEAGTQALSRMKRSCFQLAPTATGAF
jgi:hypothetical protein